MDGGEFLPWRWRKMDTRHRGQGKAVAAIDQLMAR